MHGDYLIQDDARPVRPGARAVAPGPRRPGVGGAARAGPLRRRRAGRPAGRHARTFADGDRDDRRRGGASTTWCSPRSARPSATTTAPAPWSTRMLADGTAWTSGSRWRGRAVLRISVSNAGTTDDDVARTSRRCAGRGYLSTRWCRCTTPPREPALVEELQVEVDAAGRYGVPATDRRPGAGTGGARRPCPRAVRSRRGWPRRPRRPGRRRRPWARDGRGSKSRSSRVRGVVTSLSVGRCRRPCPPSARPARSHEPPPDPSSSRDPLPDPHRLVEAAAVQVGPDAAARGR